MVSYNRRALLKTAGVTATLGGLSSVDRYGAFVRTASAATSTRVIDSFEDGDISEYYGDTSSFSVSNSTSVDGTYALENSTDGRFDLYSQPGDGLANYPSQGERFEFHVWVDSVNPDNWSQSIFHWGVQDTDNRYECRVEFHDNELTIAKQEAGTTTDLQSVPISFDLQANTWYRVQIEWDDGETFGGSAGDVTATVHDANSNDYTTAAANDTTWSDGGVGWASDRYNGETARYDYAAIPADSSGTVVDDFEDGDLDEYTAGDTGTWTITSDAYHGDHAAASASSSPQYLTSPEGGGLNYYPEQGDEFEFWIKCDSINSDNFNQGGIMFGSRPADDNYCWIARVRWHENRIQLRCQDDVDGTLSTEYVDVGFTLQENTWYRCEVRWDDGSTFGGQAGDAEFELYSPDGTDSAVATGDNNRFASGGFGLQTDRYNGEVTTVDRVRLTGTNGGGGRDVDVIEDFESGSFDAYNVISDDGEETFVHTIDPDMRTVGPLGGGAGYSNTVPRSEADWEVSTASELETAAANAADGDVIYLVDDIDTTDSSTIEFHSRVTLASNRGIDGQPGHTITDTSTKKDRFWEFFAAGSRVTGLQVVGPYPDQWSDNIDQGGDWSTERQPWHHKALIMNADDCEVDNCHVRGFGYSCVLLSDGTHGSHVHHNNIHHGIADGWGYGVETADSTGGLIEYNRFAHCRHAITNSGSGSYTARHNLFEEPAASNIIDMHQMGGIWTEVYRNTIVSWDGDIDGRPDHWDRSYTSSGPISGYIQREAPDDTAEVHHNWMFNDLGVYSQDAPRSEGFDPDSIDQAWPETSAPDPLQWEGVSFWDNHFSHSTTAPSDRRATDTRRCHERGGRALAYLGSRKRRGYLSTSGLDHYPQSGDTWRFYFRWEGTKYERGLAQVMFGVQSETAAQDYYELDFHPEQIQFEVDDAGSDTSLLTLDVPFEANFPYEVEVDWPSDPANNGITITVTDVYAGSVVASGTATPDATWTDGGIGFYGNSHSGFMLDDFEIL